jgi:hypothetical protein
MKSSCAFRTALALGISRKMTTIRKDTLRNLLVLRGALTPNEASDFIRSGKVSMQGKTVRKLDLSVRCDVNIKVGGRSVPPIPLIAVYNKPVGMHCTMSDNWGRECLAGLEDVYPFLRFMHPVVLSTISWCFALLMVSFSGSA